MPAPRKTSPARPADRKTVGRPSDDLFKYTTKSGVTIAVPSMATMDPDMGATEDLLAAAEQGNQMMTLGAQMRFLRSAFPDGAADDLRHLRTSEFQEFMDGWREWSGIGVGESSAS